MCAKWLTDPTPFLAGLRKIITVKKDGSVTFHEPQYTDFAVVLRSIVDFHKDIPRSEKSPLFRSAIAFVVKQGKLNKDTLIRRVSREETAFLKSIKKRYYLVTELSLRISGQSHVVKIKGATVRFSRIKKYHAVRSELREKYKHVIVGEVPNYPCEVTVCVKARRVEEAFDVALEALDVLRGIWSFLLNRRKWQRHSFPAQPVNDIRLAPLHSLHDEKGKLLSHMVWYEPNYGGVAKTFDASKNWQRMKNFEQDVRGALSRSLFKEMLETSLVRYVRALDYRDYEACFLKLWGILETLTLSIRQEEVIERASFFWKDEGLSKNLLRWMAEQRNRVVHKGEEIELTGGWLSEPESLVFYAKRYVENLLIFYLWQAGHVKNRDDAVHFLSLPHDPRDLGKRLRLVRRALTFRR